MTFPEPWLERARAVEAGELEPPEIRDASTVILARDGDDGLEVLLQRRVSTMEFGPGMHVFPGGRVDATDASIPIEVPAEWLPLLGADEAGARALLAAAVRETLEESGVLLLEGVDYPYEGGSRELGTALADHPEGPLFVSPMVPWARWITPSFETKRYDTRFFLAPVPDEQDAVLDDAGGEADSALWIRPRDGIARNEAGELAMMPPTAQTLRELADFPTVFDALVSAGDRPFPVRRPRMSFDGETPRLELDEELV